MSPLESPPAEAGRIQRWIARQMRGQNPDQQEGRFEDLTPAQKAAFASLGPKTIDQVAAGRPEAIAAYTEALEQAEAGIEPPPWEGER